MRKSLLSSLLFFTMALSGCAGGSLSSLMNNQSPAPVVEGETTTAATAPTTAPSEVHKIALLLPLKGEVSSSSQAIKNGFLAAYYTAREQHPGLDIKVIDTSNADVASVYQKAIASGVDVVVGPLTKPEVEKLSDSGSLSVPTIALNTLDDYSRHVTNNLYQFGLLPQDEAQQAAIKMLAAGHKNVAIIAPDGSWGDKIVANFANRLETDGGKVVTNMRYHPRDNFASEVCHLVAADPNQMCIKRKYQNKDMPLLKQRRTDIDAFFMVATPQQGRQIVPLLKFYYAGDLPVYSISAIYSGHPQPGLDQDLNGVWFCEMPWVLDTPAELSPELQATRKQIMTAWPDAFAGSTKLYALGIDAFNLALNLHTFLSAPQAGMAGATGKLYLDKYNHIYRQLDWAQIRQGAPVIHP